MLIVFQMVLVASLKGLTPWAHHPSCERKGTGFSHDLYGHNQALDRGFQTWGPDIDDGHIF
jgi:hypothetical protein